MNIAIVTRFPWSLSWGGAEVQAIEYSKVAGDKSTNIQAEFIDVYDRAKAYDIYHFVGLGFSTGVMAARAKALGAKVIISPIFYLRSADEHLIRVRGLFGPCAGPVHRLYGDALKDADLILPNSLAESNQISRIWKIVGDKGEKNKSAILHNGYDSDVFSRKSEAEEAEIEKNRPYVLSVSMLDERKNTLNLIEAFMSLNENIRLILIGANRSSNKRFDEKLRKAIKSSNGRVVHLGVISEKKILAQWYRGAIAHILPSSLETPGIASLEAAAVGTPVIVGDCLPVREYFKDNARLIDGSSIDSIRDSLSDAINGKISPFPSDQISQYSWSSVRMNLMKYYETLLQ